MPFAPEIVLPTLQHFDETYAEMTRQYGFKCSFNPTFAGNGTPRAAGFPKAITGSIRAPSS